jgi:hypothetical protein
MKKLLFEAMLLALVISVPMPTMAQVSVQVGVSLPPPIAFSAPPETILLPGTGVYVVPDLADDLFFMDGWWWRPWNGRWYRSHAYNSGWGYYDGIPSFYSRVPSGWRDDYRNNRWQGKPWNHQKLAHPQLQQIHQRNVQEESRVRPQVRPTTVARPQQARTQPQVRPQQQQRSAPPHAQSPHGEPEGRK